jgi:hypothetical protein
MSIQSQRADADYGRLTDETIALIKGMLARGDKQSDIAACFLINGGRISEINLGERGKDIAPAKPADLPPAAPYPSPYELWKMRQQVWRARVALEAAAKGIQQALVAVHKLEQS